MFEEFASEFGVPTSVPLEILGVRLIGAAVIGGIIGLEREWRQMPAGLRTHMLVALAACVFTIVTGEIVRSDVLVGQSVQADPVRVIEAVTAGVAFLAAGAIIQARGRVRGLTTGAGMWLAGALGVAVGLGYWLVAGIATLIGLVINILLRGVEKRLVRGRTDAGEIIEGEVVDGERDER